MNGVEMPSNSLIDRIVEILSWGSKEDIYKLFNSPDVVEKYIQKAVNNQLAKFGVRLLDIGVVLSLSVVVLSLYLIMLGNKKRINYFYYSSIIYVVFKMLFAWYGTA